jgi:hypothetical protein
MTYELGFGILFERKEGKEGKDWKEGLEGLEGRSRPVYFTMKFKLFNFSQ